MKRLRFRAVLALTVLAVILLASVFAPMISPYDPLYSDLSQSLKPPSAAHWLGTDKIGRDLLSRVIYGGRQSIVLAFAATVLSMVLGTLVGLVSGYFGGWVDAVITMISNIFQGLPGLTLMIAVAGLMGSGVTSMLTAIVINSWVGFSRIVRGEVMHMKQESYIHGLRAVGSSHRRILFSHISPNLLGTITVVFATRVASVIISVAALSYLGLGMQPPTPDWGVMISEARSLFRKAPLLAIAPGLCILSLSLCVNILADELRDHFDVRKDELKDL